MLVNLMGQLNAINTRYAGQAAFMGANQQTMNMLSNPLQYSPKQALETERRLMMQSFTGRTMAKYADAWQEYLERKEKKEEERKLNLIA